MRQKKIKGRVLDKSFGIASTSCKIAVMLCFMILLSDAVAKKGIF